LILCGEPDVFISGLSKTDDLMRLTSLKARLNPMELEEAEEAQPEEKIEAKKAAPSVKEPLEAVEQQEAFYMKGEVLAPVLNAETAPYIHPLIGMNGISPYDFLENEKETVE